MTSSSSVRSVVRLFARHAKRYRWMIAFIVMATVVDETLRSIGLPYVAKLFFDAVANTVPSPLAVANLTRVLWIMLGVGLVSWTVNRSTGYSNIAMQARMMADLEQSGFAYLIGHSFQFFQDRFAGALVRRITRLARAFEDIADNIQQKLIPIVVAITGILIVLFYRSALIGSIVLAWVVTMTFYNYVYARWKIGQDVARAEQDSKCTGFLSDVISNIVTIKLFTGAKRETTAYRAESNLLRDMRLRAWQTHNTSYAVQFFIVTVLEIVVLWFGVRLWSEGRLSAGDLVLFQSYFVILNSHVLNGARMIRSFYTAFADAKEMVDILDEPHAVQDRVGAKPLRVQHGAVVFDSVQFSYGSSAILHDFDLSIAPGERVALVGSSGAGKSTVIKLLFRFYDVTRGIIRIDDQNIAHVTQDSLRAAIALVPQEPVLFHRTLRENIRYGKPRATDADVIAAAKAAHCDEFIRHLPDAYETYVGERGIKLSGGERQRIAIARAILKNAPILVLDEATSSLDSESEGLIQDALKHLMRGKTAIVIAHRLSTIMQMDRILVMERGNIVDAGTHDELVKHKGIYQTLWEIQAGGFMHA